MKKITLLSTLRQAQCVTLCFLLLTLVVNAQTPPNAFNYSAVARNAAGQPIATTTIGIQITILKTSPTGVSQYSENHFVNTDAYGLFNLVIGAGAVQSGSMATIDWSNDNYYLKVGMDATGGTNFLIMGTTQLLSVPYAMYAKSAGSVSGGGKTHLILSGDITDAEAAIKIQNESGPNTQFVIIKNTTNLTSVDLSNILELINIQIENNSLLSTVNLLSLQGVYESMTIVDNPLLANGLSFSNMQFWPSGNTSIGNNAISILTFPNLTQNSAPVNISNNSSLTSVSFPSLTISTSSISISQNPLLSSVSMPNLTSIDSAGINIVGNSSLNNIDLSSLNNIISGGSSFYYFAGNQLSSANVNFILNIFANSITTVTSCWLFLSGQIPAAPPTGQGITDKSSLQSQGCNVFTD
jgi:hypothetical protein